MAKVERKEGNEKMTDPKTQGLSYVTIGNVHIERKAVPDFGILTFFSANIGDVLVCVSLHTNNEWSGSLYTYHGLLDVRTGRMDSLKDVQSTLELALKSYICAEIQAERALKQAKRYFGLGHD